MNKHLDINKQNLVKYSACHVIKQPSSQAAKQPSSQAAKLANRSSRFLISLVSSHGLLFVSILCLVCAQLQQTKAQESKQAPANTTPSTSSSIPAYNQAVYTPPRLIEKKFTIPPESELNEAQRAFWKYLSQYNRAPTAEDLRNTDSPPNPHADKLWEIINLKKPYRPQFTFLPRSETPILGNTEALLEHIPLFLERHRWVKPFLKKHEINLEGASHYFKADPFQLIAALKADYSKKTTTLIELDQRTSRITRTPTGLTFTPETHLYSLLIYDFLAARGTDQDHQFLNLIMLNAGPLWHHEWYCPFPELRKQAGLHFFWALITNIPLLVDRNSIYVSAHLSREEYPARWLSFRLWLLDHPQFPLKDLGQEHHAWQRKNLICAGEVNNFLVKQDFHAYALYFHHLRRQPTVRPPVSSHHSPAKVTKILFKLLSPTKNYRPELAKYQPLLDAAYPAPPREIAFLEKQAAIREKKKQEREARLKQEAQQKQ